MKDYQMPSIKVQEVRFQNQLPSSSGSGSGETTVQDYNYQDCGDE